LKREADALKAAAETANRDAEAKKEAEAARNAAAVAALTAEAETKAAEAQKRDMALAKASVVEAAEKARHAGAANDFRSNEANGAAEDFHSIITWTKESKVINNHWMGSWGVFHYLFNACFTRPH
jgi:hypothetical protein